MAGFHRLAITDKNLFYDPSFKVLNRLTLVLEGDLSLGNDHMFQRDVDGPEENATQEKGQNKQAGEYRRDR